MCAQSGLQLDCKSLLLEGGNNYPVKAMVRTTVNFIAIKAEDQLRPLML